MDKVASAFESLRMDANDAGMRIKKRQDYLPQQSKRGLDLVKAVREKSRAFDELDLSKQEKKDLFNVNLAADLPAKGFSKEVAEKLPPNMKEAYEFISGAEQLSGKRCKNFKELEEFSNNIKNNKMTSAMMNKRALSYEATAAFERVGDIPEFIREYDAERLYFSYLTNLSKAQHLNQPLKAIEAHLPILNAAKLDDARNHIAKYVEDMSGLNRESLGRWQQSMFRYHLAVDNMFKGVEKLPPVIRGGAKISREVADAAPEIMSMLMGQVYPNLLGLNAKMVLRNMSQPFLMTGADMSTSARVAGYAHRLALKNTMKAARTILQKGPKAAQIMRKELEDAGFPQPDIYRRDFINLEEGVRTGWIGKVSRAVDKWSELALNLYSYSDLQNRYVTLGMANEVGENLLSALKKQGKNLSAGESNAMEIASELPRYMRRVIRSGNEEEIMKRLRSYYNSATQLTYGKAAMNQFGRDYGQAISMFTKWPSAITSDLAAAKQRDRLAKTLMFKYFGPLAGLATMHP